MEGKSAARTLAGTNLGNNRDTTRQHNLSTVLGLVHSMAGVSRAQLTRATGLNRSTIAALVGELAQLGLVVESDLDQAQQHGRRRTMAAPQRDPDDLLTNAAACCSTSRRGWSARSQISRTVR